MAGRAPIDPPHRGLFVPAGAPKAVLDKLVAAHTKAMANPAVRAKYAELGVQIIDWDAETFRKFVAADFQKWMQVVTDAKISAE